MKTVETRLILSYKVRNCIEISLTVPILAILTVGAINSKIDFMIMSICIRNITRVHSRIVAKAGLVALITLQSNTSTVD